MSCALQLAHRAIAVDCHDEGITQGACLRQIAHVAHMQEIEDTVREDHALTGLTEALTFGHKLFA